MAVYRVTNLSKVNTTLYREGDLFLSDKGAGLLINGRVEPIMTRADVRKMIRDEIRKGVK